MKQHVSMEQIKVLDDLDKLRLRKLWNPRTGSFLVFRDNSHAYARNVDELGYMRIEGVDSALYCAMVTKEECIPLLSIGEMLEILYKKYTKDSALNIIGSAFQETELELCDVLWEEIQNLLK